MSAPGLEPGRAAHRARRRAAADGEGLIFYQRPLPWRLRRGDILLFLDLPGTGGEAFFDVLARLCPVAERHASPRWPEGEKGLRLVAEDARGARLIRARVDYEFYRFLPRPPVYATILRDPVERIVALYDRVRDTPGHPYHARVVARGLSLHDFVCEPAFAAEIVDAQARRIAGGAFGDPAGGSALLQRAQANLGELAFFGIAERMREAVYLLAYTFGWPVPRDLDVGSLGLDVARGAGVAPATREAIEARVGVDRALVRFAGEQFDQRLRAGLLDLLEQNSRGRERYLQVLGEYEQLGRVHERLEQAWSWQTAERLKRWRRAVIPPGSRRDRLYQQVGAYVFGRRAPAR